MNRFVYSFLFVYVLLQPALLVGQTPVLYSHNQQHTFVVHWQAGNDPAHQIPNAILRELARGNNQRPERTEFSLRFRSDLQLTRRGNRLVSQVELRNFRLQGDFRYRGFDMSDVLLPQVEFVLRLQQGNTLVTQFLQRPRNLEPESNTFRFEFQDTLSNDNNLRLVFDALDLSYTQTQRRNFTARVELINDYFSSDALLQRMFGALQSFDMYQLDFLRFHQQQMHEIGADLRRLQGRNFPGQLALHQYDPIAFLPKLNDIAHLYDEQSRHLAFVMENLHLLYYERGLELAATNPAAARVNYQQSLDVNARFAPAMAALAHSFLYDENDLLQAIAWIRRAAQLQQLDVSTLQQLQQLSTEADRRLQGEGRAAERRNQYREALRHWQMARDFCMNVHFIACSEAIEQAIARNHTALYNQLCDQAQQLLEQNRLADAEALVREAVQYQREYAFYLPVADRALTLLQRVKNQQYQQHIEQGTAHLQRNSFRLALEEFEAAQAIGQHYHVEARPHLGELIKTAKRPLIMAELDQARAAVQRNDLATARRLLDRVDQDVQHYDFQLDREMNNRRSEIRMEVQTQHCTNIQSRMDELMRQTNQHILQGQFLDAEELFARLRQLHGQNLECGLSLQPMERRRAEVMPAITYQQMIVEVEQSIRAGRYPQATDRYNDAGRHFQQHGLERFRLEHMPLDAFSLAFHPDFIHHVARVYASQGEAHTALQLIYHLDELGYRASQMRSLQEITGRVLARQDAAQNPNLNPRQQSRQYSQGKWSLRHLRKAYAKQYRRSR